MEYVDSRTLALMCAYNALAQALEQNGHLNRKALANSLRKIMEIPMMPPESVSTLDLIVAMLDQKAPDPKAIFKIIRGGKTDDDDLAT